MAHIGEHEEFSGSDSEDDLFDEDTDALRQACMRVGADPGGLNPFSSTSAAAAAASSDSDAGDSSETENLEFVRMIRQKLSTSAAEIDQPLSLKPLCVMPPKGGVSDDDDEVFETFRAIQRRFAAYDSKFPKRKKVWKTNPSWISSEFHH